MSQKFGSFTVTIPSFTPSGPQVAFLKYTVQADPSGAGVDWSWGESNTNKAGSVTGTGAGLVVEGQGITFYTPEPGTMALLGVGVLGLIRRRRERSSSSARLL